MTEKLFTVTKKLWEGNLHGVLHEAKSSLTCLNFRFNGRSKTWKKHHLFKKKRKWLMHNWNVMNKSGFDKTCRLKDSNIMIQRKEDGRKIWEKMPEVWLECMSLIMLDHCHSLSLSRWQLLYFEFESTVCLLDLCRVRDWMRDCYVNIHSTVIVYCPSICMNIIWCFGNIVSEPFVPLEHLQIWIGEEFLTRAF